MCVEDLQKYRKPIQARCLIEAEEEEEKEEEGVEEEEEEENYDENGSNEEKGFNMFGSWKNFNS